MRAGLLNHAGRILLVAVAYYLGARFGLALAVVNGQVTPLWPPTGIGLACLFLLGPGCWPGITIGALAANLPLGPNPPAVLMISVGNTLALVCAYVLLRRVGFRVQLDRLRDALELVFLGACGAMLVSATIGTGTLVLAGDLPPGAYWPTWLVWWAGDALGVLVITPVVLTVGRTRWRWPGSWLRLVEALCLPAGIIGVFALARETATPVFFLAFPLLIWAALRFQHRAAAPCALIMSVGAAVGVVRGVGAFAELDLAARMVTLQAFNASTSLTALLLSAVTIQRNDALRAVERAVEQLSQAVAALEPHSLLRDGMLENVLRSRARTTSDGEIS
ncbi:MASE1 domain-containing protein [Actinophytocola sp.]|uniref:MASE1 domain-containing protein n=1 Tax=Actinophytocola sp. TaxID=1872138 RepID=UPI002D7F4680|nr:MASE1 domain-containing protein [Actinophytocola sp.]HET9137721.1 MASE1 domain-containing protein [Actinophytocola sp.]HEU5109783.1 MASE1 domain-containing protein [Micromonosporaceae bacterium]